MLKWAHPPLIVDPTDKDTNYIKDQSTRTEGYLEYTKEKEKGKVNQLDVKKTTTTTKQW